jgi:hypothetical protein
MLEKHINTDCIVPSVSGRLGNNMFMIAHAYAKALEQNRQLVVPKNQIESIYHKSMFRKVDFYVDWPVQTEESSVYAGYFQSERYFENHSEAVKSLFSPTTDFLEKAYAKYPFLRSKGTTAIHVRRGDYLHYRSYHPIVSKEYVEEALKLINDIDNILVFGDDREWCINNFSHLPSVHFISGNDAYEDIWLMSLCDNFIIPNSSFSWWGAYLSRNKSKIVVAPETWYGPDGPNDWEEIYCKGWTKLPTYYKDGYIYPKL